MKRLLILLSICWCACSLQAQDIQYEYLWTNQSRLAKQEISSIEAFNGHNYLITQWSELPDQNHQRLAEASGIQILGYLGDGHYWTRLDFEQVSNETLLELGVSSLARLPLSYKRNAISESFVQSGLLNIMSIKLWTSEDVETFVQWLGSNTDAVISEIRMDRGTIVVRSGAYAYEVISSHPAVSYVGPYSDKGEKLNRDGISMIRVNALQNNSTFGEDLGGENVNIGVWDDGLTGHHVDYNGHTYNVEGDYNGSNVNDHPTHIAGILAGRGHNQLRTMGMAPKSDLYFWDFNDDIIDEMNEGVGDYNLNIINSSFLLSTYNDPLLETTCQFPGFYVLESSEIDQMVRDNPTLTHVIANGNNNDVCQGAGIWSGIPIGLQSSKNVINVGWLSNDETFFGGSSVGPTLDGRLKPEVMAKGANVRSTGFDHTYKRLFGSSMAAPATAGSISLLYEWYFDNFGVYPDAAVIRSIICNTAFDLFFDGPDYLFGFGRVNALRALNVLKAGQFQTENISNGQTNTYTITVGAGVSQLNVGMAWTDKEAIPGVLKTLVNDIDLKVIGPDATEYFPWTLDPGIPFIAAVTGVDSINNVEQVSVSNPVPGIYTVEITGTEVPFGPQEVALNHDILETGITVTAPVGGEQWYSFETQWIRWDAFGTEDDYTIDISYDDGFSYETIGTASSVALIPATWDTWVVKDTTSHTCRIRVRTASHSGVSGPFTIMNRPSITGTSCDRHISMNWNVVRDADDYIVYQLFDDEYIALDTITDTSYVISGLENGVEYWVAVQARDGINLSARSDGKLFIPDATPCNFSNDVGTYSLWEPLGFRYKFNGELPFSGNVEVIIKNYSAAPIGGFNVCYSRDGGAPTCELYTGSIAANETDTFTFSATEFFTDTLNYPFALWTAYGSDSNNGNDTIQAVVKVVPSHPFPLPYYTGFEDGDKADYLERYFALEGLNEWDFSGSEPESRVSVGRLQQMAYESAQALTLDRYNAGDMATSQATLNLNLNGYADSTIYLDFAYAEHLEDAEAGDRIWARADESEPWIEIFDFTDNQSDWRYTEISAINLSRILQVDNGQSFGRCFQIRFGQEGGENAVSMRQFEGRSFDDIHVYSAGEDIELVRLNIQDYYCDSLAGTLPITATIYNNSLLDANNITIGFTTSTGINHSEILSFLAAGDSVNVTFSQDVAYAPGEVIELTAWVNHTPDLYLLNDTIANVALIFQPYYSGSYYTDFETPSSFYAGGDRLTWERGNPANVIISEAASGEIAWVTNLAGRYNNGEESYLLSPCFNLDDLSSTNIAFNLKLEIEENFDAVSFEYSEDGIVWKPFLTETEAYNWFNGGGNFWDINVDEWQTASNTLRPDSLSSTNQVVFRIVMDADNVFKEEGIGVDDIHLTEDLGAIYGLTAGNTASTPALAVSSNFTSWIESGEVVAALRSNSAGTTEVGVNRATGFVNIAGLQAQSRHFWVAEDNTYDVRIYLPYEEYDDFYSIHADWSAPSDMTVLTYDGPNPDALTSNNEAGHYKCVSELQIKPYRNGYILEFAHDGAGEFYIINADGCDSLRYLEAGDVVATGINTSDGLVEWSSTSEVGIASYEVSVGSDCTAFTDLASIPATGGSDSTVNYNYTDSLSVKGCEMCYQVTAITNDGDTILVGEDTASFIFPELVLVDSVDAVIQLNDDVLITWGSQTAACNDRYDVLVSSDGVNYSFLGSVSDAGASMSWTPYSLLDDSSIKEDTLCYTVVNYFIDGSFQYWDTVCVVFEADSLIEDVVVADFTVTASGDDAIVDWTTSSESGLDYYVIYGGSDCSALDSIGTLLAGGTDTTTTVYSFTDSILAKECLMCYAVEAISISSQSLPVGEETISFITNDLVATSDLLATVQINTDVQLDWSSTTEACNDRYEIFVRKNQNPFVFLAAVNSLGDSPTGNIYNYLDNTTPKSDTLCYQLVQVFQDETSQIIDTACVIYATDTNSLAISSAIISDALCFGTATGAVDITVVGGTPPYLYRWSNGATTEDLNQVPAGNYLVVVEDAEGTIVTSMTYIVGEPDLLVIANGVVLDVDCAGSPSGSITGVTVDGGTEPYNYQWSNGSTAPDNTGLIAGDYQLTVTDANGCESLSAIYSIEEPQALGIGLPMITHTSCDAGDDGAIEVEAIGGQSPYSYEWDNAMSGSAISGLSAGSYVMTVTDDNGCVFVSDPIVVNSPDPISITSATVTDASCAAGSDGAVDIDVVGGIMPYAYLWSNAMTTPDLEDVSAGSYNVTITDANGCSLVSDFYEVGEADAISLASIDVTDASCFDGIDGEIQIAATGGQAPYTYLWSDGSTTDNATGLAAADYTVEVTDANGCTFESAAISVGQPDAIGISDLAVVHNTCSGEAFGSIDITISGGTGSYVYSWSNGATTADILNLESGLYVLTVTDEASCVFVSEAIEVTSPDPISVVETTTQPSCPGDMDGSITLAVSGGIEPYNISWSTGSMSVSISDLSAGTYSYTITDANSCRIGPVEVVVTDVGAVTAIVSLVTDVACQGESTGSIAIEVSGGTAPFSYLWNNSSTSEDLSDIPAGNYEVMISDANGCTGSATADVSEPAIALEVDIDASPESAIGVNDGSVDLTVTGGDMPYVFEWSNGATTEDISGLQSGLYCATVTDANGCAIEACASVDLGTAFIELFQIKRLVLYPNPAQDAAILQLGLNVSSDVDVALIGVDGVVHWSRSLRDVVEAEMTMELGLLPAATYIVQIRIHDGAVNLPLVIQH